MADDGDIREVFSRLLVHYFDRADALPTDIRLILYLNRWASVPVACMELTKMPKNKRLSRDLSHELAHMQAFGRPECDTL